MILSSGLYLRFREGFLIRFDIGNKRKGIPKRWLALQADALVSLRLWRPKRQQLAPDGSYYFLFRKQITLRRFSCVVSLLLACVPLVGGARRALPHAAISRKFIYFLTAK